MTTTRLQLPTRLRMRRWIAQRDPIALTAMIVFTVLIAGAMLRQLATALEAPATTAAPTPALIFLVPTDAPQQAQAPAQKIAYQEPARYVVAFAAPDGAVLGPIPAPAHGAFLARYGDAWLLVDWQGSQVWVRSADLGMFLTDLAPVQQLAPALQPAPAAAPPAAPVEAVPTPAPGDYQTASQPAGDFYAPPNTSIEARQQLIGSDPDALACNGSSLCGGMTNAEAQQALDRQRNIQQHYANDAIYPTLAPMEQNAVTQEWARQQYAAEHPSQ